MRNCPTCRRPIGRQVQYCTSQVRIPKPPAGAVEMLMAIELMYEALHREVTCGQDAALQTQAARDLPAKLVNCWPELRDLIWRAIGRAP